MQVATKKKTEALLYAINNLQCCFSTWTFWKSRLWQFVESRHNSTKTLAQCLLQHTTRATVGRIWHLFFCKIGFKWKTLLTLTISNPFPYIKERIWKTREVSFSQWCTNHRERVFKSKHSTIPDLNVTVTCTTVYSSPNIVLKISIN